MSNRDITDVVFFTLKLWTVPDDFIGLFFIWSSNVFRLMFLIGEKMSFFPSISRVGMYKFNASSPFSPAESRSFFTSSDATRPQLRQIRSSDELSNGFIIFSIVAMMDFMSLSSLSI